MSPKFCFALLLIPFLSHAQSETPQDLEAYFTAIIVKDFKASNAWYSDVLGFEVLNSVESAARGFKQSNLKRGNTILELIELKNGITPSDLVPNYDSKTRFVSLFKTGFLVSNFDAWMTHLTAQKVDFHGSVVVDPESGKRMVIIKDPDGNRVQIFEK